METIKLDKPVKVFYITASSFPEGIGAAHQRLHELVGESEKRTFYGLSRPENNNGIVYKAAAGEITPGEGSALGCETMEIAAGNYVSIMLNDYLKDIPAIDAAFKKLLSQPGLDPQGYCVEWYVNERDVRCMVRLGDK